MIRYLKNSEIDKNHWDNCIKSSPDGIVYAESWYLDIVSPGWEALVDDYNAVFPLTWNRKWSFHYLYQPYFTQQLGLFTKDSHATSRQLREFIHAIPAKFKLVEIQLNASNKIDQLKDFRINERLTHHLRLAGEYQFISKNYSENLSRNIKKARNAGISIDKKTDFIDVINLFRKERGKEIQNLGEKEYRTFERLMATSEAGGLLEVRGVKDERGNLLAGAIFLASKSSYIFLFSATSDEGKNTGAMAFIIDSFIKDHSGENKFLDFEGSMDKNLSRFYKSFGSQEIVYLQILKNKLPFIIRWLK